MVITERVIDGVSLNLVQQSFFNIMNMCTNFFIKIGRGRDFLLNLHGMTQKQLSFE